MTMITTTANLNSAPDHKHHLTSSLSGRFILGMIFTSSIFYIFYISGQGGDARACFKFEFDQSDRPTRYTIYHYTIYI